MTDSFPPIHLYALFGTAVAFALSDMKARSGYRFWLPWCAPVVSAIHIWSYLLREITGCVELQWDLISHGLIFVLLIAVGAIVHWNHLTSENWEHRVYLPPLDQERASRSS